MIPHNIESRRWNGYRVGYRASDGQAVRIYGRSGDYRCVHGWARTLKQMGELLQKA